MFHTSTIESESDLKSLVSQAKNNLDTNLIQFDYPASLKNPDGQNNWLSDYNQIDLLNASTLLAIDKRAGVYAIYVGLPGSEPSLKYIGQTNQKGSKQRIRSHLVWRNTDTKSKKYTGSKFDEIVKCVIDGQCVFFSFCEISPAALRHYVEENLIPLVPAGGWNKQGVLI